MVNWKRISRCYHDDFYTHMTQMQGAHINDNTQKNKDGSRTPRIAHESGDTTRYIGTLLAIERNALEGTWSYPYYQLRPISTQDYPSLK